MFVEPHILHDFIELLQSKFSQIYPLIDLHMESLLWTMIPRVHKIISAAACCNDLTTNYFVRGGMCYEISMSLFENCNYKLTVERKNYFKYNYDTSHN